jgi:hypothetical protein
MAGMHRSRQPPVEHVEVASTHAGSAGIFACGASWRTDWPAFSVGFERLSLIARTTRHRSRPRRGWPSATKRARARKRPGVSLSAIRLIVLDHPLMLVRARDLSALLLSRRRRCLNAAACRSLNRRRGFPDRAVVGNR